MKRLMILVVLVAAVTGCSKQPITPVGTYLLDTAGKSITLAVQGDGNYSLKVSEPGRQTNEIRGHWQDEDGTGSSISFSGIIWEGTDPRAGNGFWKATIEGPSQKICLDGEGIVCFARSK
ncbi:hypothetical protein [Massilia sp. CF038]|uniref:hypothetical protein n=1 Tax=Massilia sp. CF038 TaxID=1881045 RepID=UPI001160EEF9|nr:hypothetical protein [Massilia sp. CF038]